MDKKHCSLWMALSGRHTCCLKGNTGDYYVTQCVVYYAVLCILRCVLHIKLCVAGERVEWDPLSCPHQEHCALFREHWRWGTDCSMNTQSEEHTLPWTLNVRNRLYREHSRWGIDCSVNSQGEEHTHPSRNKVSSTRQWKLYITTNGL